MTLRIGIEAGLACSQRPTGVEYFARSMLHALIETIPQGVEVHVYLAPGYPLQSSGPGLRVHHRPDMNTALKTPWLVARSFLDRLDLLLSFGHFIPRWCRGRHIPTIYDTIYEELPEYYAAGVPQKIREEVSAALSQAWAVLSDSHHTAHGLRRFYQLQKPVLVVSAAARAVFKPAPSPLSEADPYFLYVGRIDRRKNLPRLVEAYRKLVSAGHSCRLILVGPADSGLAELEKCLAEGQVAGESIVRPGYLQEDELVRLYQGARGFVFPSLAEGFGIPILEAMACGTPVITSNCSALAEVAGEAALQVSPHDTAEIALAMQRLLEEPQLGSHLRQQGLDRAGAFTWSNGAVDFWRSLQALPL